jgi:hypothetical protein
MPWSLYVDGNQTYNLIIYLARICSSCWTPMQEWMMRIMRICEYESVWNWIGKFQSSQLRIHIFKLNPSLRPPLNSSTTTCDQTLLKSPHLSDPRPFQRQSPLRNQFFYPLCSFRTPDVTTSPVISNRRNYDLRHGSDHSMATSADGATARCPSYCDHFRRIPGATRWTETENLGICFPRSTDS